MDIHEIRAKVLGRQRKIFTRQGKYSDSNYRRLRCSRIFMQQIKYSDSNYNRYHTGNNSMYF